MRLVSRRGQYSTAREARAAASRWMADNDEDINEFARSCCHRRMPRLRRRSRDVPGHPDVVPLLRTLVLRRPRHHRRRRQRVGTRRLTHGFTCVPSVTPKYEANRNDTVAFPDIAAVRFGRG